MRASRHVSAARSGWGAAAVLLAVVVALVAGGCGRARGVAGTRRALEQAGYHDVAIDLRAGGGIGIARVATAAGGPPAERTAEVVWATLPVRFDQLVVAIGDQTTSFGYEDLRARLGSRDPSLDGRQVDEEVVSSGLKLMLLLSVAALLSVGAVVAVGLVALRAARRRRQDAGPTSGLGAGSLTAAGASASDEADAIPS